MRSLLRVEFPNERARLRFRLPPPALKTILALFDATVEPAAPLLAIAVRGGKERLPNKAKGR
jgi:hypothetical protein